MLAQQVEDAIKLAQMAGRCIPTKALYALIQYCRQIRIGGTAKLKPHFCALRWLPS